MAKKILTSDGTPQEGVVNLPNGTTLNEPVNVEDLGDVNLTSVQGGESLVYDAVAGEWINDSVVVDTSQIESDISSLQTQVDDNTAKNAAQDVRLDNLEASPGYDDSQVQADILQLQTDVSTNTTNITTNTNKNTEQDGRLDAIEAAGGGYDDTALAARVTATEDKNTAQDGRLDALEAAGGGYDDTALAARVTATEDKNTEQDGRLTNLENAPGYDDTALEGRVTQNETDISSLQTSVASNTTNISTNTSKNEEQDGRLDALEAAGGGGASTLPELTDVTITSPTDGQSLVYDNSSSQWVNQTVSGGGDTSQIESDIANLQIQANVNTTNIDSLQTNDSAQDDRLDALEATQGYDDTALRADVDANTAKNATQDSRLDAIEAGGIPGATSLGQLADVTLASEEDGQALVYDLATGEWVNGSITAFLPNSFQWATASTSFTTNEVGPNALTTGSVDMGTTNFQLTKVTTSVPARFRLYLNNDFMVSDLNRGTGELPTGEHGLITELVTTSVNLDLYLPVSVFGFSAEDPISNSFAWSIQNLDTSAASIQVDLEYYMVDVTGTLGGLNLPELQDVNITNVQQGDVITYDSATQEWTNEAVSYDTSGIESDISALQSQVSTNTGNISTNSGNITSLQSQVDQNTSNINVIISGGGAGGGSTVWLGTVTEVINGDQGTIRVDAGNPINGSIVAANKSPGFVYTGDKVVGTTTYDLEYVILSREFNYPDMPAFDPVGGIAQDGADIACLNNGTDDRLYYSGSTNGAIANSLRSSTTAKVDPFNGLCYFTIFENENNEIKYALISDSAVYGTLIAPASVRTIISYADYLIAPQVIGKTIYYYDYNVQDWGILTGFQEEIENQKSLLSSTWNSGLSEGWSTPHLFVPSDGKLHALVMGAIPDGSRSTAFFHLVYETTNDPLIGTWTTANVKELNGVGDNSVSADSYAKWSPTWDCVGTMVRYEVSSNVSNNANKTGWWDFSDNSITDTENIYTTDDRYYWAHPMSLASNAARPYSSCNISRGSENLILTILNYRSSALTQIELTSFPVSTYPENGGEFRMTKGVLDYKNGYYVAPLINKSTNQAEIWKFDMYGQAVKLWESAVDGVYDSSGFPEMNIQQGRASNSSIVAFILPLNECRTIFWFDLEA
jgi:tetrahydromethanopterin S-methyltransferase subunit B